MEPFKLDEKELVYLLHDQIDELLKELICSKNPHVELCALVCLHTGSRWGEAENLNIFQVRNSRITFSKTKSYKVRLVPISPEFEARLLAHYKKHHKDQEGKTTSRLFAPCDEALINALKRAVIALPKGQKTHVLRHTFASWFIMNGGNILTLQKILGHASIQMTLRYAHLSPDNLSEAVRLNPMIDKQETNT